MPKDACYRKVKARYKVFPSAYASGAIASCRKNGAKNWGNAKKKADGGVVKMASGGGVKFEEITPGLSLEEVMKQIKNMDFNRSGKRGAKFTVDSKGNVTKNFKNGGNVSKGKVKRPSKNPNIARGCGIVMENRRKITKFR